MSTKNCVEIDFWQRFDKAFSKTEGKAYADLIQSLRQRAQDYFKAFGKCWIHGVEIEFEKFVAPEDIEKICQNIWDHPEKYSEYQEGSESAYYNFLKFLWVEFPDGTEKRLADIVLTPVRMNIFTKDLCNLYQFA